MDEKISARARATPAQIGVRLICGERVIDVMEASEELTERIRDGHDFLVSITGKDFGYDLAAWHDHLKETREGGYSWGRHIKLPKIMQSALASREWQEAVKQLSAPRS
jgi:hypothetical protein